MSKGRLGSSRSTTLAIVLTLTLLVALSIPTPVSAATLRVRPGGGGSYYATIQAAVNVAILNDVIHVYPGTYNEGVVLNTMLNPGNISIIAVDSSGNPTPRTATVNGGAAPAFDSGGIHPGDVTIGGFVVTSAGSDGIRVQATGDVVIENAKANGSGATGILVGSTLGDILVRNCTANNNSIPAGGIGISGSVVGGSLTVENCTANNNYLDGIRVVGYPGGVRVTGCIARGNGLTGIHRPLVPLEAILSANGNIICGNDSEGLNASAGPEQVDAEGNWWGCSGGPLSPGCDTVGGPLMVDFTPWISTYTADATPGSGVVGQPVQISFQFSDSAGTMFLPKGPGDLNGSPTFTLHTDNGTLTDSDETGATVHEFIGSGDVLSVTLVPDAAGTATVAAEGPCDLAAAITIEVSQAEEFVPEPGSVILLASGLMGLAGYASLRWRSKD